MWKERGHVNRAPRGRFRFRTTFRNSIYDVLLAKGFKETDSETDWDFLWIERDWVTITPNTFNCRPELIHVYRSF